MAWQDYKIESSASHRGLIYIAVPSLGAFFKKEHDQDWEISEAFLKIQAALRVENPNAEFVSPSLQNYTFIHYMPQGTGADYETWKTRCRILLPRCDKVLILPFPKWRESIGVTDEIQLAIERKIPVELDIARPEYGASPTEALVMRPTQS